jgi:formate hydrogenlyase subunit 3/multisubunit Na+/H+ antiporter MnhD subunit
MKTERNITAIIFIAIVVLVIGFLVFGGGPWLNGMTHGRMSNPMLNGNWIQILICLGIGFLLGWVFAKRRR